MYCSRYFLSSTFLVFSIIRKMCLCPPLPHPPESEPTPLNTAQEPVYPSRGVLEKHENVLCSGALLGLNSAGRTLMVLCIAKTPEAGNRYRERGGRCEKEKKRKRGGERGRGAVRYFTPMPFLKDTHTVDCSSCFTHIHEGNNKGKNSKKTQCLFCGRIKK